MTNHLIGGRWAPVEQPDNRDVMSAYVNLHQAQAVIAINDRGTYYLAAVFDSGSDRPPMRLALQRVHSRGDIERQLAEVAAEAGR
jgi:hypothetical protein